ncbi:carbohydrate ABC transporter permease [Xylanimonas cellulosilytica]|uniref:carbohydrate ABC transporter permease n=1 Tax=Xylanimonas cellulosilytica TaxID=186189 RepID=UPI001FDFE589|nr:sugar ABC transporter permease [Xylanimonas cellulosilytica]
MATPTLTSGSAIGTAVRRASSRAQAESRLAMWLVSPTVLVIGIVVAWPTLVAARQSLFGAPGFNAETGFFETTEPFVGLGNYAAIFTDAGTRFWTAFWNTTFFTVTTVLIETVLGVAMALIMHKAFKGRAFLRASILVPWAIPTAVSALMWRWIFNVDGIANAILPGTVLWSAEGFQAKLAIIIADTWKTAPFVGLLVLAGLQVIPDEVYEAAKIDGANAWRRFRTMTLPLVKPALLIAVLFRMLDALRMFDLPYILIGPRKSSVETLSMLVHDEASNLRFGSASAYALVLFVYVFAIAFAFVGVLGADVMGDSGGRTRRRRRAPAVPPSTEKVS